MSCLLPESIHLQGAALTPYYLIVQYRQADINITKAPYQTLPILVRQMAARHRTAKNQSTRKEVVGLELMLRLIG